MAKRLWFPRTELSAGTVITTLKSDLTSPTWALETGGTGPLTLNADGTLVNTKAWVDTTGFDEGTEQLAPVEGIAFTARATAGSETEDVEVEIVIWRESAEAWALQQDYDIDAIPIGYAAHTMSQVSIRLRDYDQFRWGILHGYPDQKGKRLPQHPVDVAERCGARDLLRPWLRLGVGGAD